MRSINATAARRKWSALLGRVEHRGVRFAIHRNGREVAALVPFADLDLLGQLEDEIDLIEAREAIAAARGKARVDWATLKAYAGLES